ncbi:sodium:solute symporter family protein [Marinoscillum furvescens]|uniref:Na+/proline symporter n=1 Tax=Marinoscillum furvescens DSM 4134 TaxID=1122208 RepID=A0A3D9KXV8_MARFU|nr:sodium:solute symporter family protein [Marinoscillum furvescens]RED92026.1 Na+/proline symporter [Marinoscillum furvescens DSM 4134]
MKLQLIDILIILAYLVATIVIGLVVKKQAQRDKSSYLLGGNQMPWYFLGLSNASGMFDISGTMWLVTALFVYGVKSIWLPWLWPMFNQIFLMVYLSAWLRRSNVTTGAEWIITRFGKGREASWSHTIIVIFAIANGLGFLAYGFIGLGKFMEIFLPWELISPYIPFAISLEYVPHFYGIVFTLFAVFYALLGGMISIVWTDVLQYTIMTISAVVIGAIAIFALQDHVLEVPQGWESAFWSGGLGIDWSERLPGVMDKVRADGYQMFTAFFMMMVCKGFLVSSAGPTPTYDMQKILATRSPSDAAKMSGFVSVVLLPARYLMIAGFAVLGILFYDQLDLVVAGQVDYEQVLPSAINEFVPTGVLGLLLAGLLAAFMSTFAGTLNAVQAYVVNDLYLRHVKPEANKQQLTRANYLIGLLLVGVSVALGMMSKNVNQILQIIVSALWGGYVAANILKWYWWRFNGYGFFWGMLFGMFASALPFFWDDLLAYLYPSFAPDIRYLYYFPFILGFALIGSVAGTLATAPTDMQVLKDFYKSVKPWGFWGPVHEVVKKEHPDFQKNRSFWMDMFNIIIGTVGQTALVALPIYLVIDRGWPLVASLLIALACGLIMKKTWWDKLQN